MFSQLCSTNTCYKQNDSFNSLEHEFYETCHSVTFIVLVNSHQRWKQPRNRVCFHLWCELTSTMNVTEWQVSWNSCLVFQDQLTFTWGLLSSNISPELLFFLSILLIIHSLGASYKQEESWWHKKGTSSWQIWPMGQKPLTKTTRR